MKSFFKKLSLVLVAAMVITMIPAQSAKAANGTVMIGEDKEKANANTKQEFTLKVGETGKYFFYGATGYKGSRDGATKKYTVKDPTVFSIGTDGNWKALKAGTTTVDFSCVVNGKDNYTGKFTVTVVDPNATVVTTDGTSLPKQKTWNGFRILTDTKAKAEAIKESMNVKRVVQTKKGGEFTLNAGIDKNKCKITETDEGDWEVLVSGFSKGATYRVKYTGCPATEGYVDVSATFGKPDSIVVYCDPAYLSDDAETGVMGEDLTRAEVELHVKVIDEDGIELDPTADSGKVTYKLIKADSKNITSLSSNNKKVKFKKLTDVATVEAKFQWKEGKKMTDGLTDVQSLVPTVYVEPDLGDYVSSITLVKNGTKLKDVVWPDIDENIVTINVGKVYDLAFFFETPEEVKYRPELVSTYLDDAKTYKDIKVGAKKYYAVKEDTNANCISVSPQKDTSVKAVKIRGWKEGEENLCVYEQVGDSINTANDKLVGYLIVKVDEESRIDEIELDNDTFEGFKNVEITSLKSAKIKYKLFDQNGDAYEAKIQVKDADGKGFDNIEVPTTKQAKGEIILHFDAMKLTGDDSKTMYVTVIGEEEHASSEFTFTNGTIDTTKTNELGYNIYIPDLKVDNTLIKTKTIADNDIKVKVDLRRSFEGHDYDEKMAFQIIGDTDVDDASPVSGEGLFVVIRDSEGRTLTQDAAGTTFKLASEISGYCDTAAGEAQAPGNNAKFIATDAHRVVDLFANSTGDLSSKIEDGVSLLTGEYSVSIYRFKAGTTRNKLDEITSDITFKVENAIGGIVAYDTWNEYEYDADNKTYKKNDTKIWDNPTYSLGSGAAGEKALVEAIVAKFPIWIDKDCDGEITDSTEGTVGTGEILHFSDLKDPSIEAKYQMGANGAKEVYIKSVIVRYALDDHAPQIEQKLEVNRKYTWK